MMISAMAVCVIFLALIGKALVYAQHGKILIVLRYLKFLCSKMSNYQSIERKFFDR